MEPFDTQSTEEFIQFLSIKVKTSQVFKIHYYLHMVLEINHSEMLQNNFCLKEIEGKEKHFSMLNITTKENLKNCVSNNPMLTRFIEYFFLRAEHVVEAYPMYQNISVEVKSAIEKIF